VPEFAAWFAASRAVLIAFALTFFKAFDVPVFWPILLLYFCVLFALTMRERIAHMIKYRYLPFTWGKATYGGGKGGKKGDGKGDKGGGGGGGSGAAAAFATGAAPEPRFSSSGLK
jgi:uncharacterized membrane protein YgcG